MPPAAGCTVHRLHQGSPPCRASACSSAISAEPLILSTAGEILDNNSRNFELHELQANGSSTMSTLLLRNTTRSRRGSAVGGAHAPTARRRSCSSRTRCPGAPLVGLVSRAQATAMPVFLRLRAPPLIGRGGLANTLAIATAIDVADAAILQAARLRSVSLAMAEAFEGRNLFERYQGGSPLRHAFNASAKRSNGRASAPRRPGCRRKRTCWRTHRRDDGVAGQLVVEIADDAWFGVPSTIGSSSTEPPLSARLAHLLLHGRSPRHRRRVPRQAPGPRRR